MANPVITYELLSAWSRYFYHAFGTKTEPYDKEKKWCVMDPSDPAHHEEFFMEFNQAEAERIRRNNDQETTFGPLCAIYDVSSGRGWHPDSPLHAVLATRNKTTIVTQSNNDTHLLEYEREKFTTFLVVVPRDSG